MGKLNEKSRTLLKFYMNLYGYTRADLAEILNIPAKKAFARVAGRTAFRDEEVKKLKDALQMSTNDVMRIFYPDLVLTAGESKTVNILKDIDNYLHVRYGLEIVISSKLDLNPFKTLLQRFLFAWINNPRQSNFKFELSEIEKIAGNKMFGIHELLVQKQTETGVIHYRLFRRIELTENHIILTLDKEQLCKESKNHLKS